MAPADWAILVIFVLSVFSGLRRGFFVKICSLLGVIGGLLLASRHYEAAAIWFHRVSISEAVANALGFVAIAVAVMVIAGLLGKVLRSTFSTIGLGWMDRLAGGGLGLLQGGIVVTLLVMAIAAFLPHWSVLEESRFAGFFLSMAHTSTAITPAEFGDKIRAGIKAIESARPVWMRPEA
jgi:membrane protein required for colicin V production